jgi:hypothetical protein
VCIGSSFDSTATSLDAVNNRVILRFCVISEEVAREILMCSR